MPEVPDQSMHIDFDQLRHAVEIYRRAAEEVSSVVTQVFSRGRLQAPWANDPISVAMADHYHDQIFSGEYCTYAVLRVYEQELLAIIGLLDQMQASYEDGDSVAASEFSRTS